MYYDPSSPVISFSPTTENSNGEKEFYLFDDNPEYLNPEFLADGEAPSSIAYFENLSEGVYTVFSYHHRGTSISFDRDLFFDTCFLTEDCRIEILSIGLDRNWNWNQAWADFTGIPVYSPVYYETSRCTCGRDSLLDNGVCEKDCEGVVYDKSFFPEKKLNTDVIYLTENTMLSDILVDIEAYELNKFRYGGEVEPIWLMMKFRIVSGSTDFATIAYSSKDTAKNNLGTMKKGRFYNEPQYKGMADSAPLVTAEFDYTVTDSTPKGVLPVTVKNMRVPAGYSIKNGCFATYINTWRPEDPIAAESDILPLRYKDDTKPELFGNSILEKDNIWRFDPYHTKLYSDDLKIYDKELLSEFGVKIGDDFVPNIPMKNISHPSGNQKSPYDFYRLTASNLGNFGVTTRYVMHIKNSSDKEIRWIFDMNSDAGQVYRYRLSKKDGTVLSDNFGCYIVKLFDNSPAQILENQYTQPAKYSSQAEFVIPKGTTCIAELEITTLTGCNSPMYNTIIIDY